MVVEEDLVNAINWDICNRFCLFVRSLFWLTDWPVPSEGWVHHPALCLGSCSGCT